jgi:hypothetical protein
LEDKIGRPVADHHAVRAAAAESLGKLAQTETLDRSFRLIASRDDEPRVLAAIATALQHCPPDEPRLIELATFALDNTRSYAARANIMETLGHHATTKARPETRTLFERALETDSQHETVRRGTLRGLAECNHPDGLELAIPFTRKGHLSRLRPEAINTVAALSHHDPEKAARAIAPLLYDREEARTVAASINALSRIEHDHALDALTTFPTAARHPVHAQLAENARDQLAATLAGEQTDAEVRESIQRLERQLREFREQIDAVGDR